ncbi:MAG TPA: carbohydrate porin, partial [Noviherbaspirillum sp.]
MKKRTTIKRTSTWLAVMLAIGAVHVAHADVTQGEFHGYFRAGAGSNSEKGSQACFGLNGVA